MNRHPFRILLQLLGFLFLLSHLNSTATTPGSQSDLLPTETSSRPSPGQLAAYTGEQYDPDLGLFYLRARYYSTQLGRFWSMDSWEGSRHEPITLNKYLYGNADPVNKIDPTGHFAAVGGGLGGASIGSSMQSSYNGGVSSIGNAAMNQLFFGGSAGVTTILIDSGLLLGGGIAMSVVGGGVKVIKSKISAFALRRSLAQFKHAAEFGILPVKALKTVKRRLRNDGQWPSGTQIHHLVEQRFATTLGIHPDDFPGIVLTAREHQEFTNAWRDAIGRINSNNSINTSTATPADIWAASERIYANYPEVLEFVKQFLGR